MYMWAVCLFVFLYLCMHGWQCVLLYACLCVGVQIYNYICKYLYTVIHMDRNTDRHIYIHAYIHIYKHTYLQTYKHTERHRYICDSLGIVDGFNGLTKVVIYPACATQLQRTAVLTFLIPGQIDAGWQATQLTHKQLKHTSSGCSR